MNEVYTDNSNPIQESNEILPEEMIEKMKAESEKYRRNDRMMLSMILLTGLVGFTYVFFLHGRIHPTKVTKDASIPTIVATQLPTKEVKRLDGKNQLTIKGVMEANEKIRFVLDSYNDEVIYTLRFGNGTGRVIKEKVTEYTYPSSGVFQVTLEARFKNEELIMFNEYISIDDAITVADGAFQEHI